MAEIIVTLVHDLLTQWRVLECLGRCVYKRHGNDSFLGSGCFLFFVPVRTTPQGNCCSVIRRSDNRHCDGGGGRIELFPHEDVCHPEEAGMQRSSDSPPEPFIRIWRPHPGLPLATVVQQ